MLDNGEHVDLDFEFSSDHGKKYLYLLGSSGEIESIGNLNLEVIVTILGGNLIVNSVLTVKLAAEPVPSTPSKTKLLAQTALN